MDKKYLKDIVRKKRTMISVFMCLFAVAAVSTVTGYRSTINKGNITEEAEVSERDYIAEDIKPVISSKNAEAGLRREDVLTVVEEYDYEARVYEDDKFVLEWPVVGEIVMDFSEDKLVYDETLDQYRTNDSVSISADEGDKVIASEKGVVKKVAHSREDGWYVVVDHENGWETTYGQLKPEVTVKEGQTVNGGEIIGYVAEPSLYGANLGNHVEFKVTLNDYAVDPKTAVGEDIGE